MGSSDKKAFTANAPEETGYGPIATALKWDLFDRVYILYNELFQDVSSGFQNWLVPIVPHTKISMIHAGAPDPTDYTAVYSAAANAVHRAIKETKVPEITFQTSSGTNTMGFVWLILQQRCNARLIKSTIEQEVIEILFPFNITARLLEKGKNMEDSESASLIYKSMVMARLVHQVQNVAPLARPVLLEGPSGTGKELIAKLLHNNSGHQGDAPFVAVNCGAIVRELMESELFGHSKGAFTGANKDKTGKIEQACNGTLFLDEIGEMPMDMQVKLLRVLQEMEITRVGDDTGKPRKVTFRLVAATNRNLVDEVNQGRFREDLYYRIAVITLKVPSLKKRGAEDIDTISDYCMEDINREFSKVHGYTSKTLTPKARETLSRHHWPGNVRELFNVLYRAAVLNPEISEISGEDIKESLGIPPSRKTGKDPIFNRLDDNEIVDLEAILNEVRYHYFTESLKRCHGNVTQATEMLMLKNRPLHPLKKLGIDPKEYKRL